jgi:hypothetical protein
LFKEKASKSYRMKIPRYKKLFGISFLYVLLFVSGCGEKLFHDSGFLEGVISIGPLCPVETYPPDPGCLPTAETYKAYPVSVWTPDGNRKVKVINPSLDGSYILSLAPGKYLVMLEIGQNRIIRSNLPMEVSITANNNFLLNIDIDTGIR